MPRYKTDQTACIAGVLRQAGEEFTTDRPIITRAPKGKDGKRAGKKAELPSWLHEIKETPAAKASNKKSAAQKKKEAEEQQKELEAAGVNTKQTNFMVEDGKVETV